MRPFVKRFDKKHALTKELMFEEEIVICAYGSQSGRTMAEKQQFCDELACERNLRNNAKMVLS